MVHLRFAQVMSMIEFPFVSDKHHIFSVALLEVQSPRFPCIFCCFVRLTILIMLFCLNGFGSSA